VVGDLCDDGKRILVVETHVAGKPVVSDHDSTTKLAGTIVAITRADGKRVVEQIDARSMAIDNCGGTGGGHAGCSMSGGKSISSRVLGEQGLFFGTTHRDVIFRNETEWICRNVDEEETSIDACSTTSWFAVVRGGDEPYLRVFAGDGGDRDRFETPLLQEPVKVRDRSYAGQRAVLTVSDDGGTLAVDGKTEPCIAVRARKK
jgi:hypothetical protein